MNLASRDRLLVVGKTGTGKSHWVKRQLTEWIGQHRVIVFDPCDEYSQLGRKGEALGPLRQRCTVEELLEDTRGWMDRKDLALAVVSDGDPEEVASDFETVADLVKHTGRLVFVAEEVGYYGEHCQSRLKAVATMYRHREVAAVFVSQRAIQVPLTARSQASVVVAFKQDEPDDLEALRKRCGLAVPDIADRVARLRVGESVTWRDLE